MNPQEMSPQEMRNILQQPYDRSQWIKVLRLVFAAKRIYASPQAIHLSGHHGNATAVELGQLDTQDESLVGFYEVQMDEEKNIERTRVGLREMLRQVYKYAVDGAIVVFVQGNKWRCSYISEIRQLNPESQEFESKATEPRRFTYLFGAGEVCRTAAERFAFLVSKPIRLSDIFDAFSVEKLNKEFFTGYNGQYNKFCQFLAGKPQYRDWLIDPNAPDKNKQEKPIRDYVKLLLGRIVFLHFLQKKGWMSVPENQREWRDGDPNFMQNLFEKHHKKELFLSQALHDLFFKTLNTKRDGDLMPDSLGRNNKAPYLNGGLFDMSPGDKHVIDFPPDYFKDLFEFFSRYNFTIDENDPFEAEVGIDPEMLGRIFENLLEENREKGTFYTPKEIVHYMCQESLIQYLRSHLIECTEDHAPATKEVENLIRYGRKPDRNLEPKSYVVRRAKDIEKLLDNVKICDPAIGSGAFPMGLLREIHQAKMLLDYTLDSAEVKKHIIQNSIYGVDIERGAVDIARLRFWLALVVDENIPQPLPNLDYKIMQGNSLLEQFEGIDLSKTAMFGSGGVLTGDTQIDMFGKTQGFQLEIGFSEQDQADIKKLIREYFHVSDRWRKEEIHAKIDKIVLDHLDYCLWKHEQDLLRLCKQLQDKIHAKQAGLNTKQKEILSAKSKDHKELRRLQEQLFMKAEARKKLQDLEKETERPYFLWHLYFKDIFDQGGFDIVIGNPPYIRQEELGIDKKILKERYPRTFRGTADILVYFVELAWNTLKEDGVFAYIISNKWIRTKYGEGLRRMLLKESKILEVIDFGDLPVFAEAIAYPSILRFQKSNPEKSFRVTLPENIPQQIPLLNQVSETGFQIRTADLNENGWQLSNAFEVKLLEKLNQFGLVLEKYVNGEACYGIKTGLSEAFTLNNEQRNFLISSNEKNKQWIKPYLIGRDITPYAVPNASGYLLYIPWHFPLQNDSTINGASPKAEMEFRIQYPDLYQHLSQFKDKLSSRNKGETGIRYEWYAMQRSAATYIEQFDKPKIMYQAFQVRPCFVFDEEGLYCNNSMWIIPKGDKFLLGYLNSAAGWYAITKYCTKIQNGYQLIYEYLRKIPVPNALPEEKHLIEQLVNKVIAVKKAKGDSRKWENKINAWMCRFFKLNEEEMNFILDVFPDMSIIDKTQIQNEYWRIAHNKFTVEL